MSVNSVSASNGVRVLYVVSNYPGMDSPVHDDMVARFDNRGFCLKICYLRGAPNGKNKLDAIGKAIYLDPEDKLGNSRVRIFFALLRLLKEERPDILHCHRHMPTVLGSLAARFSGVKGVVAHVHGLNRTRSFLRRFFNRFTLGNVDTIFTVSESVRADVLKTNPGLDDRKVITLYNGIVSGSFSGRGAAREDLRRTLGIGKQDVVFINVGRLAKTKGQAFMIEAFAVVRKKHQNAVLLIAGGGELKDELSGMAEALGVSANVRFLGFRQDIPELLAASDVFVFPSLAEGLPYAVLEAMDAGLPIVATNVGGIPELLSGELTGKVVPPSDANALSMAMLWGADLSEAERKNIGVMTKKRVKDVFTTDKMIEKLEGVYRTLLGSERAR